MAVQPAAPVTPTSAAAIDPAPDRCAGKHGTVLAPIVLARPWQWIKKGLVPAALVFSHPLFRPRDAVAAALAPEAFLRKAQNMITTGAFSRRCATVERSAWRTRGWIVGNGYRVV